MKILCISFSDLLITIINIAIFGYVNLRCSFLAGQFASVFMQQDTTKVSNPFNGGLIWGDNGSQQTGVAANPFRTTNNKVNGISSGFYTSSFPATNGGSPWVANPFSVRIFLYPFFNDWDKHNKPIEILSRIYVSLIK